MSNDFKMDFLIATKQYICVWCGLDIVPGSQCVKVNYIENGQMVTGYEHQECME